MSRLPSPLPPGIEGGQLPAVCALSPLVDCIVRPIAHFLLAAFFVVSGAAAASGAEKKDTRPVLDPPPPAMPLTATVGRGERIEISLRIYGQQNELLRYVIKKPPLHGRVSEPRVTSREVSTVIYEPPTDLAVTADRFSYSAQSRAGVSAPVEVTISITDVPSRLAVAATLDFGELLAGETAVREIEVANRGGGLIEGRVEVDPPLQIEGRAGYRLAAGDYTYFKIVFAPSEAGTFRREIRYTSDRDFITSVTGSAQAPISAQPTRVELRPSADTPVRTTAFEIVNRTDEERTFQLRGDPRLVLPAGVTVAARGRSAVAVSTRAEDVALLEGAEIRVESSGFALVIPARGDVVGPILRLPQSIIALGRVDSMRGGQATVEIENVGGTSAQVTAEVSAPFVLAEPSFSLEPLERKRVRLSVLPGEAQRYRTWLKFTAGPTSAELEVEAELVSNMSATSRPSPSADRNPAATPSPATPAPWVPDLHFVKTIRVTSVTTTSADLEWPAELDGAAAFEAQRLVLTRDSAKELRNAWIPITKTQFTRRGTVWVASVTGLEPSQSQTIRIVPLSPEGKPKASLFRLDFSTLPRATILRPRLVPTLFVFLLIGGGLLLFRRARRHYSEPISGF